MDTNNIYEEDNSSYKSISTDDDDHIDATGTQAVIENPDIGESTSYDVSLRFPTRHGSCMKPRISVNSNDNSYKEYNDKERYCHVKLESIWKLKESTKRLLCLLDEIQTKTITKKTIRNDTPNLSNLLKPTPNNRNDLISVSDLLCASGFKKLESQTDTLDAIYIPDDDDNCSIYKRLTRKCNCLNKQIYNDFIIHFNEDVKFYTSNFGEVIKNMRILKKFLYMNGDYTKHALMFLNEGLSDSSYSEKVEIAQGCAYADMCNVFDEHSIAIIYISWPCTNSNCGDPETQDLTATLLHNLAELEEGRRYLNFSSKITNDVKKILRKKISKLHFSVVDSLKETLNLLHPPLTQHTNVTYYCKPLDEGLGIRKTINALVQYRQYMTLDEVLNNLELLDSWSNKSNGKMECTLYLPALLELFRNMLVEYDHSPMNIIVTSILSNIVANSVPKKNELELPKTVMIADIATEPVQMKNGCNQIPLKIHTPRNNNKSKLGLGLSPNNHRAQSKRKVSSGWGPSGLLNETKNLRTGRQPSGLLNKSRNIKKDAKSNVIVVPVEE